MNAVRQLILAFQTPHRVPLTLSLDDILLLAILFLGYGSAVYFAVAYFRARIRSATRLAALLFWMLDVNRHFGESWPIVRRLLDHMSAVLNDHAHPSLSELLAEFRATYPEGEVKGDRWQTLK